MQREKNMKIKLVMMLAAAFALQASAVPAQELPRKVSNVELLDLDGNPAGLPIGAKRT